MERTGGPLRPGAPRGAGGGPGAASRRDPDGRPHRRPEPDRPVYRRPARPERGGTPADPGCRRSAGGSPHRAGRGGGPHPCVYAAPPTQKLQIIQSYQSAGLSVVMVGDGFNDVLALKVADVGIAMGLKGADMARKAADLVLEDDALENVAAAIEGGRRFYGNMRRSLRFVAGAAHVDIAAALAAKAAAGGSGLNPLQPVWTNMAALALAVDAAGSPDGAAPPGAAPVLIDREQIGGAAADAARVMAASSLTGAYALARYGGGAAAGRVFWSSLALNQLLLALRGGGREGAAAERPRPVLWGIAGLPLLLLALSGGGLLDLLVIAGGGWLARRWAGGSGRGPDVRPSEETA
ncbi:MAG: hypothetical protein EHM15_08545 [Desulfobacteraceae bacterium]|nr:MAG: hypothetical protein EHM15_08545 [Desulfobacteraceae bacterium]